MATMIILLFCHEYGNDFLFMNHGYVFYTLINMTMYFL